MHGDCKEGAAKKEEEVPGSAWAGFKESNHEASGEPTDAPATRRPLTSEWKACRLLQKRNR